jgi:citrate lyase subunit beta / citryl-CoA lyase
MHKTMASVGNQGEKVRSDCFVHLELQDSGGLSIEINSKVKTYFGRSIEELCFSTISKLGIQHAHMHLEDSGALPFVIMARIEAAARELLSSTNPVLPEKLNQNTYETARDRFRFSRLYLPGNTPSMMINAGIHQPNGVILDLEDSVAPPKKMKPESWCGTRFWP